ncbi:MAG: winged helix-turn-helix domain-containing protein [Candidatus Sifarchaeia archaeon]
MVKFLSINRLAYLNLIRNVRRGLETRTQIIDQLDTDKWVTTSEITRYVNVTSTTVLYHLKNLERERIVERKPEGHGWRFGPFQQSDLSQYLETKPSKKRER